MAMELAKQLCPSILCLCRWNKVVWSALTFETDNWDNQEIGTCTVMNHLYLFILVSAKHVWVGTWRLQMVMVQELNLEALRTTITLTLSEAPIEIKNFLSCRFVLSLFITLSNRLTQIFLISKVTYHDQQCQRQHWDQCCDDADCKCISCYSYLIISFDLIHLETLSHVQPWEEIIQGYSSINCCL